MATGTCLSSYSVLDAVHPFKEALNKPSPSGRGLGEGLLDQSVAQSPFPPGSLLTRQTKLWPAACVSYLVRKCSKTLLSSVPPQLCFERVVYAKHDLATPSYFAPCRRHHLDFSL